MILIRSRRNNALRFLLIGLLCATGLCSFAADTLDDRQFSAGKVVPLINYSRWFEDTTGVLTATAVMQHPEWFSAPVGFQERNPLDIYWERVVLSNRDSMPLDVVVSFSNISFVDLYYPVGDSLVHRRAGTFRPARELAAGDGREWVTITVPPHSGYTLLIRAHHIKHYWPDLRFKVRDERSFLAALSRHRMTDALMFGAVAILFLYSLVSWLLSFYRPYFWLLFFIATNGLYALSTSGYFIDWLTPQNPEAGWMWNIHLIHAGSIGALVLLMDFWKMRERWPGMYRLLRWVIAGLIGISVLSFGIDYWTGNFAAMNKLNLLFLSGCVSAAAYVLFTVWSQVRRPQRILGYGYVVYLSSYIACIILWIVVREKAIIMTAYLSDSAMLCVTLLFSLALKEELRQYEKDKNMALQQLSDWQQQQNILLEDLVQARTRQLQDRNQRIETLMQEVHHRVKNNLQLLYGLMTLQLPDIEDLPARDMLKKNLNRIKAMSIVNEKLYGSNDVSLIRLQDFIRETAAHVSMMYDGERQTDVRFVLAEDIIVTANFAVPFGLILTELLTNSFKYAVPGTEGVVISIDLRAVEDRQLQLDYRDNGCDEAGTMLQKKGFSGLKLVRDLVRQLHGRMESWQENGWCYRILAPMDRR